MREGLFHNQCGAESAKSMGRVKNSQVSSLAGHMQNPNNDLRFRNFNP